ncbi:HMG (high mobility group) box-containing protein [Giardia duodenalis]|uniref:HMG (High mobility group) box-containing protein n=1 Tax=Giardia intestinalis (strain ATCC 50803 / WB clone C6) TaxID=184922 RepID=A8BW36_GIAIC|nr:HMG (high mobility group) box-containing protein [Giardia intestinalis]KAE8302809.1 HMG (high mobility group) box-containing protein [Giardia intestinalis]|eukprot:XP_001704514.1 Hypothetical protein GL50803_17626 [Giardia lamblia ATCC 50803]
MEEDAPQTKPTKPFTPYFAFMHDHLDEYRDVVPKERTKVLGRRWKELDEKTRKQYTDSYEEQTRLYKEAMKKWLEEHPEDRPGAAKEKPAKRDVDTRERRKKPTAAVDNEDASPSQDQGPNLGADAPNNLRIFFIVGYVLKYAERHNGRPIPNDKRVRKVLSDRYDSLSAAERDAWAAEWLKLDEAKRLELVTFYNSHLVSADA